MPMTLVVYPAPESCGLMAWDVVVVMNMFSEM